MSQFVPSNCRAIRAIVTSHGYRVPAIGLHLSRRTIAGPRTTKAEYTLLNVRVYRGQFDHCHIRFPCSNC